MACWLISQRKLIKSMAQWLSTLSVIADLKSQYMACGNVCTESCSSANTASQSVIAANRRSVLCPFIFSASSHFLGNLLSWKLYLLMC